LYKNKNLHGETFNFGPSKQANYQVINILLEQFKRYWPKFKWKIKESKKNFFESKLLKLNSR
jgi:CDP-glucose 4,6-dehydratase